jgi:hypothetical protein
MQEEFPKQPNLREKYLSKIDKDGYLLLADTRMEFNRQIKSIAGFLDGEEGTEPDINYGNGIRYKGSSGNYSDMKIHIDDLEVFIERVKKYYGEQ